MNSRGLLDKIRAQICSAVDDEMSWREHDPSVFGDSPIERLMALSLEFAVRFGLTEFTHFHETKNLENLTNLKRLCDEGIFHTTKENCFFLRSQCQYDKWRVDFVATTFVVDNYETNEGSWRDLIIECDGHEFHERTKQQAARDRSRDRMALSDGFPLLRYTGSEIWNDPLGCAQEVITLSRSRLRGQ